MKNEHEINSLLHLDILHASLTRSDRRVVKGTILPEDGTHDISPENATIYNDDTATDLIIKQGTELVYPDKPNTEPPNSPDEPFPTAA